MFYQLRRVYFTVCRIIRRCIGIFAYIWHAFAFILMTIKKTLDTIGHTIVWSLGMFILTVKYFFGFISVVGVAGGLIALLLGFGGISFKLAIAGGFGCLLFFIVAVIAPNIGRINYYDNN